MLLDISFKTRLSAPTVTQYVSMETGLEGEGGGVVGRGCCGEGVWEGGIVKRFPNVSGVFL